MSRSQQAIVGFCFSTISFCSFFVLHFYLSMCYRNNILRLSLSVELKSNFNVGMQHVATTSLPSITVTSLVDWIDFQSCLAAPLFFGHWCFRWHVVGSCWDHDVIWHSCCPEVPLWKFMWISKQMSDRWSGCRTANREAGGLVTPQIRGT